MLKEKKKGRVIRVSGIFQMILLLELIALGKGRFATAWSSVSPSTKLGSSIGLQKLWRRKTDSNLPIYVFNLRRESIAQFASIAPDQSGSLEIGKETSADDAVKAPFRFVPYPFSYRQEVDIRIETLTNRGQGLGRVALSPELINSINEHGHNRNKKRRGEEDEDDEFDMDIFGGEEANKWVVMVPAVIPGELVRVRIFRNFRNYSEADVVEVLEASEDRITPRCPLAGECGGCQMQHMTIKSQRLWKTRHVEEGLEQYNVADLMSAGQQKISVLPCLGTDQIFEYRSKLTPHYNQPSNSKRGERNVDFQRSTKEIQAVGFQKQSSRQIVDVPRCPIATPEVNAAYAQIRERLYSEPPKSKKGATLLLRQANLGDTYVESNHREFLTTVVKGLKFSYRAGNFFQNNYYVLPLMVDLVVSEATRGGEMTHLADCYCGSGLFALSCAAHFERVVGIEINDKAILEAKANAEANSITNCDFMAASAENIFSVIGDFPRDTTAVVLDPPRKGCSEDFIKQLHEFRPARIVYMSCDPTTQARDAASIVQGGYSITMVQPFDLFPQTRHIECLMILERIDLT